MDLSTTYMGLELKNPLVPSASPLTADVDKIRALEDAGASAVVLHAGIVLTMGLFGFGSAMLMANAAFVPPRTTRRFLRRLCPRAVLAK